MAKVITREELISYFNGKSEEEIALAIMYAENYMKYGTDITEKIETATQQAEILYNAERHGYYKAIEREPVQPLYTTTSHPFHVGILYHCGNCHCSLDRDKDLFCSRCGKPIDWEKGAVKWE